LVLGSHDLGFEGPIGQGKRATNPHVVVFTGAQGRGSSPIVGETGPGNPASGELAPHSPIDQGGGFFKATQVVQGLGQHEVVFGGPVDVDVYIILVGIGTAVGVGPELTYVIATLVVLFEGDTHPCVCA